MIVEDVIYGRTRLVELVLIDLIGLDAFQRLRGILQHGITGLIGVTNPTTRFDHSMGVMMLVRRLGGSVKEQMAALLHDISHTAFSHVIDYVYDEHDSQAFHEEMKETYLAKTDLPDLLAQHGYFWRGFLDEDEFSLLEQPAPALCADRLDYFLRDGLDLGLAIPEQVSTALNHLVVHNGRIAVDSLEVARWMAYTYIAADEASWANFREVGLYELTARAMRMALEAGALTEEDIWSNDAQVWTKLNAASEPSLQSLLRLISPETGFAWDEDKPDFRVSTKLRTIDPGVLRNGRIWSLSELDPDFADFRTDYLHSKQGDWPMRVVPH